MVMIFRQSWLLALLGAICFAIPLSTFADNRNTPPYWPWHGINLAALSSKTQDLEKYKFELNINMVRLHFINHTFKDIDNKVAIKKSFQWLDQILDKCAQLGITSVINLDFFPLGKEGYFKNTPDFWQDKNHQIQVIEITREFADHFKIRGKELAAYDVMSEPLVYINGRAQSPEGLFDLQTKLLQIIKQVDSQRWVVFSPGPGGGPEGYANYLPPVGEKIIWGVHIYIPHSFTHQGIYNWPLGTEYPGIIDSDMWNKRLLKAAFQPILEFQKKHLGPVWIGEFSAVRWSKGGEQYLHDVTEIFNENKWGWAYFSGTGWHGWHPDFDSQFSTDKAWKNHRIGLTSKRWQTLKEIFNKKP